MDEQVYSILLVDDEENILNALKRLLRKEGYRLISATSGRDGLQLLNSTLGIIKSPLKILNVVVFHKQIELKPVFFYVLLQAV